MTGTSTSLPRLRNSSATHFHVEGPTRGLCSNTNPAIGESYCRSLRRRKAVQIAPDQIIPYGPPVSPQFCGEYLCERRADARRNWGSAWTT
jgi:hypothetical protein